MRLASWAPRNRLRSERWFWPLIGIKIQTGSKSIIRYMFKPVFNSLDVAFTER
jgi:hypothetical protein